VLVERPEKIGRSALPRDEPEGKAAGPVLRILTKKDPLFFVLPGKAVSLEK
jgi:hypothetical protein